MSESAHETTEQNPFTKPGFIISAALILALIAAVALIFLIPKGNSEEQPIATTPNPPATASATKPTDTSKSICGLPDSTETALGAAPKTEWELVGTMAVPTDPKTTGPGTVRANGLKSCFAHSPTGALYATANIWATAFYGDANLVYQDLTIEGPARDAALKAITSGQDVGGGTAPKMQIQGFIIRRYTPNAAVVDLAVRTETGAIGSLSTSLVWQEGDWKLDIPAAGGNPFKQIPDSSSYIPWAGV